MKREREDELVQSAIDGALSELRSHPRVHGPDGYVRFRFDRRDRTVAVKRSDDTNTVVETRTIDAKDLARSPTKDDVSTELLVAVALDMLKETADG
jgi:hypothetical protein